MPKKPKKPMCALVVAVPVGDESSSYIISGSPLLLDDIDDGIGSRAAEDSLDAPPGNGVWMWEGTMITTRSFEGDYDVDYAGKYRRLTDEEIQKLCKGEAIIPWEYPSEEEYPSKEDIFALTPLKLEP